MAGSEEDEELRKMLEDETIESKLTPRERGLCRVDRIIRRQPGLLRQAARKALAGEHLSEDEFILTHRGFMQDECTEEMESEWSLILRQDWQVWSE